MFVYRRFVCDERLAEEASDDVWTSLMARSLKGDQAKWPPHQTLHQTRHSRSHASLPLGVKCRSLISENSERALPTLLSATGSTEMHPNDSTIKISLTDISKVHCPLICFLNASCDEAFLTAFNHANL